MARREVELGVLLDELDEPEDVDPADEAPGEEPVEESVPDVVSVVEVVEVSDPVLDDVAVPDVAGAVLAAAVAAVAPGDCRAITRPTTPVRAAAEMATDVVARRTRLRAPSRRRRSEALGPKGSARCAGEVGGWDGAGGVITAWDHPSLGVSAQSDGSPL